MIDFKKYDIDLWPEDKVRDFRAKLLAWYDDNKRDLPWRRTQDPYAIWVSEIMLQQTRVDTVIPYYERFLDWFPTVADLADAPEEKLLKAWEGLGYYSRVRNMQVAAQQVVEDFDGVFPQDYAGISSLKGIGPYTAGAIASIAFGLPEPAVDGNVMRVLARLFEIKLDIGIPSNRKVFQALMEVLIDPDRPGDFNQALMDLGSDIEAPVNPHPEDSPVKDFSAAYLNGTMDIYPIKAPKKKPVPVFLQALVVKNLEGQYLLEKNENDGLLSGFWHFPLIEVDEQEASSMGPLWEVAEEVPLAQAAFEQDYDLEVDWDQQVYSSVKHVFSHRKWQVEIKTGTAKQQVDYPNRQVMWLHPDDFNQYPFAKPQQKIWDVVNTEKD